MQMMLHFCRRRNRTFLLITLILITRFTIVFIALATQMHNQWFLFILITLFVVAWFWCFRNSIKRIQSQINIIFRLLFGIFILITLLTIFGFGIVILILLIRLFILIFILTLLLLLIVLQTRFTSIHNRLLLFGLLSALFITLLAAIWIIAFICCFQFFTSRCFRLRFFFLSQYASQPAFEIIPPRFFQFRLTWCRRSVFQTFDSRFLTHNFFTFFVSKWYGFFFFRLRYAFVARQHIFFHIIGTNPRDFIVWILHVWIRNQKHRHIQTFFHAKQFSAFFVQQESRHINWHLCMNFARIFFHCSVLNQTQDV